MALSLLPFGHNTDPRENIWTANVTFASQLHGPSGQFISISCFHVLSQFSFFSSIHPFFSFNTFLSLPCFFPLFFHKRSSNFLPFPSLFALSSLSFFVNTLLCWYDCCNFELFPFCSCFLTVLEK